jgi:hypothetical protein
MLSQERIAISVNQAYNNLTNDAASDRAEPDRAIVILELLLGLRQYVKP